MTAPAATAPALELDLSGLGTGIGTRVEKSAGLEPLPASPTTTALATQSKKVDELGLAAFSRTENEANEPFSCRDMLSDAGRQQARQIAEQVYPKLLDDPVALSEFGNVAVEEINALVKQMLGELGKSANIPEVTALAKQLDDRLRGMTRKYDPQSIAETREQYEKMKGKVLSFFNKYRDLLHMLVNDAKGVDAFLDSLEAELTEKGAMLQNNVRRQNDLYRSNEASCSKLTGVIAIQEYVRDVARESAQAVNDDLTANPDQPNARQKREQRDTIIDFIKAMDTRVSEFKQRLFIAYATSPQIRNIRSVTYGVGQRLALLKNLTIPVWRLTIVQWANLIQAAQAAELAQAVSQASDSALSAFARAAGEMVPATQRLIDAPTFNPATLLEVAESLATQARGLEDAYRFATAARATVETTITRATRSIAGTSDSLASAVLELSASASQRPAELAPVALPQVVLDHADEVLAA